MNSLKLLCSVLAVVTSLISEKKEIAWEEEVSREYSRFEEDFGTHKMGGLVNDTFAEGFVYIARDSVIQGDFADFDDRRLASDSKRIKTLKQLKIRCAILRPDKGLANHFTARSKLGNWELGPPQFISTCGNTAMIWSKLYFVDNNNRTQEGYESIFYEFVDNKAKVKFIQ